VVNTPAVRRRLATVMLLLVALLMQAQLAARELASLLQAAGHGEICRMALASEFAQVALPAGTDTALRDDSGPARSQPGLAHCARCVWCHGPGDLSLPSTSAVSPKAPSGPQRVSGPAQAPDPQAAPRHRRLARGPPTRAEHA
jgi:hypothetical protein